MTVAFALALHGGAGTIAQGGDERAYRAALLEALEHGRATLARGGVFHVNARSWEIDGNRLWDDLAALLSYIANRPGVRYLTNSEVLAFK